MHGPTMEQHSSAASIECMRTEPEHAHPCVRLIAELQYNSAYPMSVERGHVQSVGVLVPSERRVLSCILLHEVYLKQIAPVGVRVENGRALT